MSKPALTNLVFDSCCSVLARVTATFSAQTATWVESTRKKVEDKSVVALATKRHYITEARERWLDVAIQLHKSRWRLEDSAAYGPLARTWSMLGSFAGLHLDRMCWSTLCRFHKTPSEMFLLVCKGCHDARYCSRECQRRYVRHFSQDLARDA